MPPVAVPIPKSPNIVKMMDPGRSQDVAIAAAMRMARETRKKRAEGGITRPTVEKPTIHHSGPIMSSVAGRTDHLPMHVDDGSYVLPADIVSGLGEGNTMAGFKIAKNLPKLFAETFYGKKRAGAGMPMGASATPYGSPKGAPYDQEAMPYDAPEPHAKGGKAELHRWFSGSKVADASGKPLVVYHGTKGDFHTFDPKKVGASDEGLAGKGFYFTYNPEEASSYALSDIYGKRGGAPNVMPVYVALKNPMVVKDMTLPDGRKVMDVHKSVGSGINSRGGNLIRQMAERAGHDGVIFAKKDGGVGHAVAFRPEQIKSAVGNSGTYDPNEASITRAEGGEVSGRRGVPIVAAGGEHVYPPSDVMMFGNGDLATGHAVLDAWVPHFRAELVKTLKKLPGPKKD